MTDKQRVKALTALLREIQAHRYHEPDSDRYEYCGGCGRSPYNVPPHTSGCLVPKIARTLREVA